MEIKIYGKKKFFVEKLNYCLVGAIPNIKSINYRIFYNNQYGNVSEYIIINYVGGDKTVRNVSGNSLSGIYNEIGNYLNNGYYDEIRFLENIEKNENYIELLKNE